MSVSPYFSRSLRQEKVIVESNVGEIHKVNVTHAVPFCCEKVKMSQIFAILLQQNFK